MSNSSVLPPAYWPATRIAGAPKVSVFFVSGALAAAIPLILSLYWIAFWLAPESLGAPLRICVCGWSILLGLFWYRAALSHAEVLLFRVLAVSAIVWLIPALMATDRNHALAGWIKMLLLFVMCCFAARGLRHPATAHVFGVALVAGALILAAFVLFIYAHYVGFTLPTYKTVREFKGIIQLGGVPLNTIAFGLVFSYLMGVCLLRTTRRLLLIGFALVFIATFFTGSRTPLVVLAASLFVLFCINGLRSRMVAWRIGTALLVGITVIGLCIAVSNASDAELFHISEGRTHLWSAALQKFEERPLFGFGYESWRDDLVSRLPGEYDLTYALAKTLGGGYHNEYVSILAEEGLIGAFAAALLLWLLLRASWLLAFRRLATANTYQWILLTAIFLILRANVEVPGLFGYAQDPADYLAYLFVAIAVSRFSVEEDYARLVAASATGRAA